MGKTRRARTKFHISSVQGDFDIPSTDSKDRIQDDEKEISSNLNSVEINANNINDIDLEPDSAVETNVGEWKVVPEEDLFKNLDINVDKLETSVQDNCEPRPNISISKSIKRSAIESGITLKLKKGDKRELRRNLFIKKIDAIRQEIIKKKTKNSKGKSPEVNGKKQVYEISHDKTSSDTKGSPKVQVLGNKSLNMKHLTTAKISKRKQKTTCKLKNKTQEMLNNIDLYNQIISDTKYQTDVMGIITNAVQKRVFADL